MLAPSRTSSVGPVAPFREGLIVCLFFSSLCAPALPAFPLAACFCAALHCCPPQTYSDERASRPQPLVVAGLQRRPRRRDANIRRCRAKTVAMLRLSRNPWIAEKRLVRNLACARRPGAGPMCIWSERGFGSPGCEPGWSGKQSKAEMCATARCRNCLKCETRLLRSKKPDWRRRAIPAKWEPPSSASCPKQTG